MRLSVHAFTLKRFSLLLSLVLMTVGLSGKARAAETAVDDWAFNDRDYRLVLSVNANGFARTDKVIPFEVDFEAELNKRGALGSFDETSVRVAEVDESGITLNSNVAFQFDNGPVENTPQGTVLILLGGTTTANQTRYFEIYFDTMGSYSQTSSPDYVQMTNDAQGYRGQQSYWIQTFDGDGSTLNAQYFYHKRGAGFASIYDRDSNDWVSYYPDENSKSRGEFRGIPNLGDVFHPGYNNVSGNNLRSNSTVLHDGPLRIVIESESVGGEWKAQWAIYPTYAQMTILDIPDGEKYWFLYEGTPGGNLEYSGSPQDIIVRSDGEPTITAGQQWAVDKQELGSSAEADGEWVYFADSASDRLFFVAHDQNDSEPDSYRFQFDNSAEVPSGTVDNGAMTVMGFGRKTTTGVTRHLSALNATFTIGFGESQNAAAAKSTIYNATHPVVVTVENQAPQINNNNRLTLNEGDTAVLSNFHLSGSDNDGDTVIFEVTTPPSNGTLRLNGTPLGSSDTFTQTDINNNLISYAHDGSETVNDSTLLIPQDGKVALDAVTFSININGVNDAPVANKDSSYVVSGLSVIINVLLNDTDAEEDGLTVVELTEPAHGDVVLNGDNTITYQADKNYLGPDSFTYKISDGKTVSSAATVEITVGKRLYIFLPTVVR